MNSHFSDPTAGFLIVMIALLFVPRIFERLKLPGILGVLVAGLLLGPNALGVVSNDHEVLHFLSDVGKLMVLFFAGLEIDIDDFLAKWKDSVIYGMFTFLLPLLGGFVIALQFNFSPLSSLLIGSLLASHTLISLPIIKKEKLMNNRAITTTIGATIITDIASLLVLAITVSIHTVGLNKQDLLIRFIGLVTYFPLVMLVMNFLVSTFLPRLSAEKDEDQDGEFILLIFVMIFAALWAELIHLEGIIGAFAAGLAVGKIVRGTKLHERLETIGHTLFIPMFYLTTGSLIDPTSFFRMSKTEYLFTFLIVGSLFLTKGLAALISGKILKYSKEEISVSWALSLPQVAATLAAALVAFDSINSQGERLISSSVLDSVLILMATTVIAGPILTRLFAQKIQTDKKPTEEILQPHT